MIALSLLSLEARSARVAASLDARPELGALWRRIISISEAAASLAMEDVPVPEQDVLLRDIGSSVTIGDPQAVLIASQINTFLKRPGDILSDPGDVFDRCVEAGNLTSVIDEDRGGRVAYLTGREKEDWVFARMDFLDACQDILHHNSPILFRLMAFSSVITQILPERRPISERMMFMAAESAMRRKEALSDPLVGAIIGESDLRMQAQWTLTPSLALSRSGFRSWSPASKTGMLTLSERLDRSLAYNVGKLASLNKWMGRMQEFSGPTKRSRNKDLADLFLQLPILDAEAVAARLDVTDRGARNLLDRAREQGLITPMTQRRSYRLWAVPTMAEIIKERAPQSSGFAPPEDMSDIRVGGLDRGSNMTASLRALDDLDKAMADADRILAKYQDRSGRGRVR